MSGDLTEDHIALRDGATRFAAATFGAARLRALRDTSDGCDRRALGDTAENGWLAMLVSEDHGGAGQDVFSAALVLQAFGAELANIPAAAAIAALRAVSQAPHFRKHAAFHNAVAGRAQIVPSLTGVAGAKDGARKDDGHGLVTNRSAGGAAFINGVRRHVHAGGAADWFLIEIDDAGGSLLVLASRDYPGLSVESRRTVDGGSVSDLHFNNCVFGGDDIVFDSIDSRRIASAMRSELEVLLAAELTGIMESAIARTLDHLKTREQFGRPLGSFQALQFRMADVHMQMSLSRALTFEAARLAGEGGASAPTTTAAAFAKAATTAIFACRAMIQMHGAMGFTDEHDAGLHLKRALVLANAYGSAAEHRARVAADTLRKDGAQPIRFREDSETDAQFRAEVRKWLGENLPERLRNLPTRPSPEDAEWWHRKLYQKGWIAPAWPKQYGGMEASIPERIILIDELGAAGAPEISGQAIGHLGPILQKFGTPEQKAKTPARHALRRRAVVSGLFGALLRLRPGVLAHPRRARRR